MHRITKNTSLNMINYEDIINFYLALLNFLDYMIYAYFKLFVNGKMLIFDY